VFTSAICCFFGMFVKFQISVASFGNDKRTRAKRRSNVVRKIGSLLPLRPARRVHFHVRNLAFFTICTDSLLLHIVQISFVSNFFFELMLT